MDNEFITLKSEFAHVKVKKDTSANGTRLLIEDVRTGKINFFDPLELECLAWTEHKELNDLLNPSLTRWRPIEGLSQGRNEKIYGENG
ncbi:hypothetical protein [Domibacillus epiphyticus]|uniref:Dihydrodiol dehydrogenase n=1 Tax=Domibacillus epiphyticus TaxID=1714355 RepID=A0A1V2A8X8_9BACI|nr:hypothetical protein [Domibacillus epiphyticus]OMP67274.1 hypothetical protein BTO28_08080 [Domibacillus epiphyticus]